MKHANFVHLHVHTSYSLLDGANRLSDLTEYAARLKFPALAITDHGAMFGVVDFYKSARAAGIKPIIGQEFYVAPESRHDRKVDDDGQGSYHLVLLARNLTGYSNLIKLSSISYLEGFYRRPRIDKEILARHSEGLVALSACLKGEVAYRLVRGDREGARDTAAWYKELFGENYFLEVQHSGMEEQGKANAGMLELSSELDIGLVATNDVHYLRREDTRMHDVLLCIQTGKTVHDEDRMRMDASELYLKSAEEMELGFRDYPGALSNTLAIAERCNVEIPMGSFHLPRFPIPEDMTEESYLSTEVRAGFDKRMEPILEKTPEEKREETLQRYQARLGTELETIIDMGFPGYFLIVWDFIRYAREQGIPVGPGRGSAAGSLVAYSLGITDIDPIRYGLLFERFLNPERITMPDIDVDFCMERRDEVIRYVSEKYGEDRVAQIITFGTMAARGAIRDVGRALDMSYAEVDRIAKMVPEVLGIKLPKAIEKEPQLKDAMKRDKKVAELLELAQKMEGLHRHASTHAAGVVISDLPLTEHAPLYRNVKDDSIMTQYGMKDLESVGLVKFDFLGLRTLTLLRNAVELVNRRREVEGIEPLDAEPSGLDDQKTYDLLSTGDTDGVFQLESSGMKDLLIKMNPTSFEDLIALVALYRPGPLGTGMVTDFINRKHGRQEISYDRPELKEILSETYGVIVYQEQVMQIAGTLAGYSMGEADNLRRVMGKKLPDEMEKQRSRFLEGAREKNIPDKTAGPIFDNLAFFAGYGFNKSHSAAYALIAYRTAFLKAHYPGEFMAALLTSEMDNSDKVTQHIGVCKEMGLELLPPDINRSSIPFTVEDKGIRFGLGAVKNVGIAALEEILGQRDEGADFTSVDDFCSRVDLRKVNRRVVESLIKSGAFDGFPGHRAQKLAALDHAMERGQKAQKDRESGQTSLFDGGVMAASAEETLPRIEPWPEHQRLAFERECLGFYITGHPLEKFRKELERYVTVDLGRLGELSEGQEVKVAGMKQSMREISTKRGDRMAFLTLEDLTGSAEVIVFSDPFKEAGPILGLDGPFIVQGTVDANGDKPKIKAMKVELLEVYRQRITSMIQINLTSVGLTADDLERLRQVLGRHLGECGVRLRLTIPTKAEAIIDFSDQFKVNSSEEMVHEVERIFGSGTVTFV
ncbi:MAG: DNA polymerase III subunit alpha [bacterium]|nr:DNA polymerase III subunit alpha [bacterium]MDT8395726.1 DNA polymerase III subunit alpha [bacterium]